MIRLWSRAISSWNGIVMSIMAETMAPEIRPKMRTVFFMGASLPNSSLFRVTRTGDSSVNPSKIILSGDESLLFCALHRLRPAPSRELVEEPGGVSLDGVLADEQPFGDLA